MEERREIRRWHEVADPVNWAFEDEHGHEELRHGEGKSPQEMEKASYVEFRSPPGLYLYRRHDAQR